MSKADITLQMSGEGTKSSCDYHTSPPIEAEIERETEKARYVVLRCSECDRRRGVRRIKKPT